MMTCFHFCNGVAILLFSTLVFLGECEARAQVIPVNGDFEQADPANPAKPAHWERMDGLGVRWEEAPVVPGAPAHGKAIRMDTSLSEMAMVDSYTKAGLTQWVFPHPDSGPIAATYGLSLYSDAYPVVPGKIYRVTFDYLSDGGPGGKLWFRGYGDVNGEKKRLYEGPVDCNGGGKVWKHITATFHPTKFRANVTEFKLMLFAIYPPGVAWFDNITVEAMDDPNPAP